MSSVSVFSQITSLIPRNIIAQAVRKHGADKHAKGINTWTHLVSMLFCQTANCPSLRDISNGVRMTTGNRAHLGIERAPSRSALSYENKVRDWRVFQEIYYLLKGHLGQHQIGVSKKLNIKSQVILLDSSTITLCLSLFKWAHYMREKGAIKIHAALDYESRLPAYIHVTDGKVGDNKGAYEIPFGSNSTIVADRGYVDFKLLNVWDSTPGLLFVVRHRDELNFDSLGERHLPEDTDQHILKDEMIVLSNPTTFDKYPRKLRRVVAYNEEHQYDVQLLTNDFDSTPATIAELYKARWDIEVFFKEIKQLFRVKSFVGTSLNAVMIQLWTAFIAILLLKYLKIQSSYHWHLSNFVVFVRMALFAKINLQEWVNNPFHYDDILPRGASP